MLEENRIIKKDRVRIDSMAFQTRYDNVAKELARVKDHPGKLIDADVWTEGVMQRCLTKELKKHWKQELVKAEKDRKQIITQIESMRNEIFDLSDVIAQVKRDGDKLTHAIQSLSRTYQRFSGTSPLCRKWRRIGKVCRRKRIKWSGDEATKAGEIRTRDERLFVGMDLVLYPQEERRLSSPLPAIRGDSLSVIFLTYARRDHRASLNEPIFSLER